MNWHSAQIDSLTTLAQYSISTRGGERPNGPGACPEEASGDPGEDMERCLGAARRAVALDRSDCLTHQILSLDYCQCGQFDLGLVAAQNAFEVNPMSAWCHFLMGSVLNRNGRLSEAISYFEKGIELNPKDPRTFLINMYMADAYLHNRQVEAAAEWAQRAIARRSDFLQSHLILASSLGHQNRTDGAKAALDKYRRRDQSVGGDWQRWWFYRQAEDLTFIEEGLRKAGLPE